MSQIDPGGGSVSGYDIRFGASQMLLSACFCRGVFCNAELQKHHVPAK